jgi:hypothetical protein
MELLEAASEGTITAEMRFWVFWRREDNTAGTDDTH